MRTLSDGIKIQALSNGPTLAFKDMAMQFLGNAFEYVLNKEGKELNILGATSGDTGSAAEYALRGKKGVNVFMLSPEGKMSAFQRAQMFSLQDANIHNIAVEGMFDDCQDIVKAVQNDTNSKPNTISAQSTPSTGAASLPKSCTTSPVISTPHQAMTKKSASAYQAATSAMSAPAISPAKWACPSTA